MEKTVGQVAYEEFLELSSAPPWFPWDELPEKARDGWEGIAEAVLEHYKIQSQEACGYTFAHTRHFCGNSGCRES